MGDVNQVFYIILFAAIAGFLVLRLRAVLGRRTGNERPPPSVVQPSSTAPAAKVVILPTQANPGAPSPAAAAPSALERLRAADPAFDLNTFLTGARAAFEMIINAFAAGDTEALRPLLSEEVFRHFAEAIAARLKARETLETSLLSVKSVELVEARMRGAVMLADVKFVSDQVHVLKGPEGQSLEGDPNQINEKTDLWTFSRGVRARDPNWTLVATHAE
ncbi:MAG TPA: Tim44/TimA family putative adaptor protein [Stellaceae bacterium]|nr:Tim44/TimA family putative adaptor protein [Stellaceae bacterium]